MCWRDQSNGDYRLKNRRGERELGRGGQAENLTTKSMNHIIKTNLISGFRGERRVCLSPEDSDDILGLKKQYPSSKTWIQVPKTGTKTGRSWSSGFVGERGSHLSPKQSKWHSRSWEIVSRFQNQYSSLDPNIPEPRKKTGRSWSLGFVQERAIRLSPN